MKFREIKEKLLVEDNLAIQDWETRVNEFWKGPPSLEEQLSFVEYRRRLLASGLLNILDALVAQEAKDELGSKEICTALPTESLG